MLGTYSDWVYKYIHWNVVSSGKNFFFLILFFFLNLFSSLPLGSVFFLISFLLSLFYVILAPKECFNGRLFFCYFSSERGNFSQVGLLTPLKFTATLTPSQLKTAISRQLSISYKFLPHYEARVRWGEYLKNTFPLFTYR